MNETFSISIENVLESIRHNSVVLSEYHKKRYLFLKSYLKYFRIPLIILNSINAISAIGMKAYIQNQETISGINCLLFLICGIITSIELYLGISTSMENELMNSKEFYLLSTDIFKVLSLHPNERQVEGKSFLNEKYQRYCELIKNSNLLKHHINDKLTPIIKEIDTMKSASESSAENSI